MENSANSHGQNFLIALIIALCLFALAWLESEMTPQRVVAAETAIIRPPTTAAIMGTPMQPTENARTLLQPPPTIVFPLPRPRPTVERSAT